MQIDIIYRLIEFWVMKIGVFVVCFAFSPRFSSATDDLLVKEALQTTREERQRQNYQPKRTTNTVFLKKRKIYLMKLKSMHFMSCESGRGQEGES